jgi:tRNA(Ile)-lysidine synthase
VPPHPAVATIRLAVREILDGPVLVACSGGADSLALAAALAFEAPRRDIRAGLITIDHGLQPGSAEQAARIASLGYEFGMDPVEVVRVSVGTEGGPEAAARTARYRALLSAADALDRDVMLAHTLDDQAETVLLGLGRGSGPRSIAGMRRRSGRFVRPLLSVRRATTVAACGALGLEPWQDPQNVDSSFQRVRLRREVLPLLEDVLQGGVAEALARTAELLQNDLDALDELVAPDRNAVTDGLDVHALTALPKALRTRTLRAWARSLGAESLTAVHVAALDALVVAWHGQGPVGLPGGAQARRVSGRIVGKPADRPEIV